MRFSKLLWRVAVALISMVFWVGPLDTHEAMGDDGESKPGFFQKMKNNINSSLEKDRRKIKKEEKKSSPQGQSDGGKFLSFIKKRANNASDNIQKSIDKDKKTISRKLKTSDN